MLHELIRIWFGWVENWGYAGVFILMALESTIVPVPSEIVMPPAAFWAAQGKMSFWGVVLAGTGGSLFGSVINYYVSRWIGEPFLRRYGKYMMLPEEKLEMARRWVTDYGVAGIFAARLLPVVRHLISIPAGILQMSIIPFCVATTVGAGLWCTVLAWFGQEVIGGNPELLQSPEAMMRVIKAKLLWFVVAVVLFTGLYGFVIWIKKRGAAAAEASQSRA